MATVADLFKGTPTANVRMAETAATPELAPAPAPAPAAPAAKAGTAESLYIDPTPTYQPTLDFINKQTKLANERYAQNKADIKNIFGNLTTVSEKDAVRIEDQFVKSIQAQQAGVAQRTAEVRAQQGTARQGMEAVAAQRGGGPMTAGPTAVDRTAEEGIARSNEYQTTWEALMRANEQQAQENLRNRIAGFGQQQVGALSTLQQNLEARLAELGGNTAAVQSDIAKAKMAGQQTVANAKYQERLAANALASQQAAAANQPTSYPNTRAGWSQKFRDAGGDPIRLMRQVSSTIDQIREKERDNINAGAPITKQMVLKYWMDYKPFAESSSLDYALEYIDKYAGLN